MCSRRLLRDYGSVIWFGLAPLWDFHCNCDCAHIVRADVLVGLSLQLRCTIRGPYPLLAVKVFAWTRVNVELVLSINQCCCASHTGALIAVLKLSHI